jgi:hypothetical protein
MIRTIVAGALLAAGMGTASLSDAASGSIGVGAGKLSPRAAYAQGKALTFQELVCDGCPLQKNELSKDRARSLTRSLEAAYEGEKAGTADDDAIQALCGAGIEDCKLRMETVHYFLTRRFRL